MKMEVGMGIAVEIEMKAEMEIAVRKHRYFWLVRQSFRKPPAMQVDHSCFSFK